MVVMPLGKLVSDHAPCYVSIESFIPKAKKFWFEDYWTSHHGFFETWKNLGMSIAFLITPLVYCAKNSKT